MTMEVPIVECHCGHKTESCVEWIERRGVCLCGQFVLATCVSQVRTSKETWMNVLTSLVEGIDCPFWGSTSISRCGITGDAYAYACVIIVLVESWAAHKRITDRLDDRYRKMRGIESVKDSTRELITSATCCPKGFLGVLRGNCKNKTCCANDFTFGDKRVYEDWVWFNSFDLLKRVAFLSDGVC